VPGTISKIFVREGEDVSRGSRLASLNNLPLRSGLDDAKAKLMLASAETKQAALRYQGYGSALMQQEQLAKQFGEMTSMNRALELDAPISGTVVTPKMQDLLGSYLKPGDELLEIADLSRLKARIYLSEYDLYKIRMGETARLQVDGVLKRREGPVSLVSSRPTDIPEITKGKEEESNESKPRQFYYADIVVNNPGNEWKPGMTGVARVYVARRSLGGMLVEDIKNFWGRKLW